MSMTKTVKEIPIRLGLKRPNPVSIFIFLERCGREGKFYEKKTTLKIFDGIFSREILRPKSPCIFWGFRHIWKVEIKVFFRKSLFSWVLSNVFQTVTLKFWVSFMKFTFRYIKMQISQECEEIFHRKSYHSKEGQKLS